MAQNFVQHTHHNPKSTDLTGLDFLVEYDDATAAVSIQEMRGGSFQSCFGAGVREAEIAQAERRSYGARWPRRCPARFDRVRLPRRCRRDRSPVALRALQRSRRARRDRPLRDDDSRRDQVLPLAELAVPDCALFIVGSFDWVSPGNGAHMIRPFVSKRC